MFSSVPLSQLMEELRKVIREEIEAEKKKTNDAELIDAKTACKLFSPAISRPTLDRMCKDGKLEKYMYSKKVYFKKADVINAGIKREGLKVAA